MLKHVIGFTLFVIALGAAAFWYLSRGQTAELPADAVTGTRPQITAPRSEWFPTVNIAEVVGWQGEEKPVAAEGLRVNLFAADLEHPRMMLPLDNGDVLVAETGKPESEGGGIQQWIAEKLILGASNDKGAANRITVLRDADGDGIAERRFALIDKGLNSPFGMALVGTRLYVANTDSVMVFPFTPGQTRIDAAGQVVARLPATQPNNHWTRGLVASPDGTKLYVSVGSNSNIGENGMETEANRAAVLEIDLTAKSARIYTAGMRNPVGMDWGPEGRLWAVVNERDMLGPDLAPDYLAIVDFGADYGWPHSYWGGYEDRRVEPRRQDRLEYARRPEYALGPHVAPIGLTFADGAALGDRFARGAFVGLHGSWNRKPASGYAVVFVPFNDRGFPEGRLVTVLDGFLDAEGNARGRPAGVSVTRDGSLLVADDAGNRIWRVSRPPTP